SLGTLRRGVLREPAPPGSAPLRRSSPLKKGGGMGEKTVVLVGTLDTKGAEYEYLRDRLKLSGVKPLLVDVGTLEPPTTKPDISRQEVAAAAGVDLEALTAARDRGNAVSAMADAAAIVVRGLYKDGRCDGV